MHSSLALTCRVVVTCALFVIAAGTAWANPSKLNIYSATDEAAVRSVLDAFDRTYPDVELVYHEMNTLELHGAILDGTIKDADVVISSSVDLQVDLVNRGLARRVDVTLDPQLPAWARWRSELFGFTFEPVVTVYNRRAFTNRALPTTRSELVAAIRNEPDLFRNAIGTYDIAVSGVGYLFATQDIERGYQFWRLVEAFGRSGTRLFCCTSDILDRIANGTLVLGYNLIGSYAAEWARQDPRIGILPLEDYTLAMSRSAFIHKSAANPALAEAFISYLLSREGQRTIAETSALISLFETVEPTSERFSLFGKREAMQPIKIGPGLIGYLDQIKRKQILQDWRETFQSRAAD